MNVDLNVLGTPLIPCCLSPTTGYFRDGLCRTNDQDIGTHTVCAVMTEDFLRYTQGRGNDLTTPKPYWNFPGLLPGDKWCLCVSRWLEAEKNHKAPPIILEACHKKTLQYTSLELLKKYVYKNQDDIS